MADVASKTDKITASQNERSIRKRQCCVNNSTNRKKKKAGLNQIDHESIDKRIGAVGIKVERNRSDTPHKEIVSPIENEIIKFKKRKLGRRSIKGPCKEVYNKIKMCRLCLSNDVKMWSIYDYNLAFFYTIFTGFNVSVDDGHPQHVCWECAARLRSSFRFRERALQAQNIVASLLDMGQPTDEVLEKIDRVGTDLSLSQIEFYYVGKESIDNTSELPETNVPSPIELEQYSDNESGDYVKSTTEEDSKLKVEVLEENCKATDPLEDKDVKTDIVQSKEGIDKNLDVESIGKRTVSIPKQCRQKATMKQFEITMLNVEEQLKEFEKRKKWRKYKTMEYKCDKCYKAFNHEKQYEAHKNKHTDRHGKFVCNVCSLHFFTERGIKTHLKKHSVKYKCRRCSFVSFSWETAKCHNHSGKTYKCPHCFEVYDVYTSYLGHIRRTHALSVVCPRCGQAFLTTLGLKLHNKLKHKYDDKLIENGPHCDECDIRFATQQAFDTHLKTSAKHSSGREARRRIKNNSSVRENKLNSTILCELCNEELTDSKTYATHFKDRHPGKNRTYYPSMKSPHMCDVCGKMFQSMCALKEHMKVLHTGEVQYRCEECGKRFSTKHVLRAHAAQHRRGGLACPRCPRTMANKGNLKRHMFTVHSGQRPFKCESCGKAFADNNSKKTHVEYVHNKKPWPKRDRSKRNRRQIEEQVLTNPSESAAQDPVFIQKSYMEE